MEPPNLYAGLEKASSGQEVAKAGACAIAVLQQDWGCRNGV